MQSRAAIPSELSDLTSLNLALESYQPAEIVRWAVKRFGEGLVMSSSFGAQSAVLIHMASSVMPSIRIIMVDTGYLFPETHRFMEQLRQRFDLNVWIYRTQNDPIKYLADVGETDPIVRRDIPRCCAANKNEPFDRAMSELKPQAWLRGIRRDQSATRRDRQVVERSDRYHCYAISPILNWTSKQIHAYMREHDLPYHPLYEQGYASIGCNPLSCTRPVGPGEDPRAGRWADTQKLECGLHVETRPE